MLDEELKDIADRAHSYVGADLRDVVDAGMCFNILRFLLGVGSSKLIFRMWHFCLPVSVFGTTFIKNCGRG